MKNTTTRVYPVMPASIQTSAYADTEILFDWHEVKDFEGSSIEGIQVIVRGTNGADQTMVGIDLFFATSNIINTRNYINNSGIGDDSTNLGSPPTLGTTGAAVDNYLWKNNLIAYVPIASGDFNDGDLVTLNIATKSGLNIPVDQDLYVAAIAKGALDFRSTVQCDGVHAVTQNVVTVKTTSALTTLAVGDVVHDEDDRLIGTILNITSATEFKTVENLSNATVNNKDLYAVSPIQLVLQGKI